VRFLLGAVLTLQVAGAAANIFLKIPTWRIFKYAFARYICEANSRGTPVVEGLSQNFQFLRQIPPGLGNKSNADRIPNGCAAA
jgi:hypothetical protein